MHADPSHLEAHAAESVENDGNMENDSDASIKKQNSTYALEHHGVHATAEHGGGKHRMNKSMRLQTPKVRFPEYVGIRRSTWKATKEKNEPKKMTEAVRQTKPSCEN